MGHKRQKSSSTKLTVVKEKLKSLKSDLNKKCEEARKYKNKWKELEKVVKRITDKYDTEKAKWEISMKELQEVGFEDLFAFFGLFWSLR